MKSLNSSPDPTYTSVNLSIYAIAEVFVGVFTACLPPLRKSFDQVLHKVLPAGLISSRNTKSRDSYAIKPLSNPSHVAKGAKGSHESDADSDCGILKTKESRDEIIRTTLVSVTIDDKASEDKRSGDWV
jgi:hypothetical protein